jgi:hypothetical protein
MLFAPCTFLLHNTVMVPLIRAWKQEGQALDLCFALRFAGNYDKAHGPGLAQVPATASLEDLDDFLRHIWLECCGHLSRFQIGERSYSVQPMEEAWGEDFQEHDMRVPVHKVFHAAAPSRTNTILAAPPS